MINDDILRNIEYLREKADVSYEEAESLLKRFDGNVMRALVELERQGRVFPQGQAQEPPQHAAGSATRECHHKHDHAKKQATGFVSKALSHRLVVESGVGEDKKVIANLSAPYCAGATLLAPWLAVGSVGLMFMLGYKVRVAKDQAAPLPEDVETFVDNTVSNIKRTANSFAESVREHHPQENEAKRNDDDDDEGGEITIE